MSYTFGDVLLLDFPFTDSSKSKPRPVIVLIDTGDEDFLVARVTSQKPYTQFDVALMDWEEAGLIKPSIVRLHKLVTLHKRRIIRSVGEISEKEQERLKENLKRMWEL